MGWLKKDDRFPEHRKVRRLTDAAYRLHDTALHACAKDETDGFVTEEDIADMQHGPRLRKHVDTLVRVGLWHEAGPGRWEINDYLDYNPSHAESEAKRKEARERQQKWRKARMDQAEREASQRDNGVTNASLTRESHDPVPDPSRTRPVPVPLEGSPDLGGVPKRRASKANPQPCGRDHDVAQACGACADARRTAKESEAEAQRVKAASDRAAIRAAQAKRRAEDEAARAEAEADPERVAEAKARALAAVKEAS